MPRLTTAEAAALLGVTPQAVRLKCEAGRVKGATLTRSPPHEIRPGVMINPAPHWTMSERAVRLAFRTRAVNACGVCGEAGHNARRCPATIKP